MESKETKTLNKHVGKSIFLMRKRLGLSQEELAEKALLHRTYVSDVERGRRKLSVSTLHKFAAGLGVRASVLLRVAEQASRIEPAGRKLVEGTGDA